MSGENALDRPVWASLSTHHVHLSMGGQLARRYLRDVNLFASSRDDTAESLVALAGTAAAGEQVFLLQVPTITVPSQLVVTKRAAGVQMISTARVKLQPADGEILHLAAADAPDMVALATLTQPGPFLSRTYIMGKFIGIRVEGRLVAMAGERMRFPGHTELSGVCTHPDFRGRGLARALSTAVASAIQARGDVAILHAWKTNRPAIALYESLGFTMRAEVDVAVVQRR